MFKVVINATHGRFGLSAAAKLFAEQRNITKGMMTSWDAGYNRNHPTLVAAVEELGDKANSVGSCLKIVKIPDGVHWRIEEYDGKEHVAENHRTWS